MRNAPTVTVIVLKICYFFFFFKGIYFFDENRARPK